MEPFEFFGWTAGALLVARIVPQPWRIWRRGTSAGVSPVGVLCWLANDLGWLVYGWRADMTPIWVASAALVMLDLALVAMTSPEMRRGTVVSGLSWTVVVTACAVAGQGLLAAALVAGSATGTIPHAVHALRNVDLAGVSRASWLLASVDGLLWGVYGLNRRDLPSVVYAVLTLGTAAVILWRLQTVATTPARLHSGPPIPHPGICGGVPRGGASSVSPLDTPTTTLVHPIVVQPSSTTTRFGFP